jgi:hypothetical protein
VGLKSRVEQLRHNSFPQKRIRYMPQQKRFVKNFRIKARAVNSVGIFFGWAAIEEVS